MSFESRLFPGFAPLPPKRRVFVSYHHDSDQWWYERFAEYYGDRLELFTNRSLEEPIDSDNLSYVHRTIREGNITGTSVTIVLCGPETWKRKCVDWEIGSTLNMDHGLLGIGLPTAALTDDRQHVRVPDRLQRNYANGYAPWLGWTNAAAPSPQALLSALEDAAVRSTRAQADNALPFMTRNRP